MPKELAKNISEFLQSYGIVPLYLVTIIMVVISVNYIRYIDDWDNIPDWKRK